MEIIIGLIVLGWFLLPFFALSIALAARNRNAALEQDLAQLREMVLELSQSGSQTQGRASTEPGEAATTVASGPDDLHVSGATTASPEPLQANASEVAWDTVRVAAQAMPPLSPEGHLPPLSPEGDRQQVDLAAAASLPGMASGAPVAAASASVAAPGESAAGPVPASAPVARPEPARPSPYTVRQPEPAPEPESPWLTAAKAWLFGGNLVAKIGLLILFIGVGFLLKYASAHIVVPIELRLTGITLTTIGLLLWGWRIRGSRPGIALPVQGTALATLMLVTFAAFRLYQLMPAPIAFALLLVLVIFTCVLAILQDAFWLALFGIAGGFAAPIVTSTGNGSHIALFSYYALLNGGILALSWLRAWRGLNFAGFLFTFVIGTIWGVTRYQSEFYGSTQGFLLLFFLFYVAIGWMYGTRHQSVLKNHVDATLVFGTPFLAFGLQYGLVRDQAFGVAWSSLALGLFYSAAGWVLWQQRGSRSRLLTESFIALAVLFGTLAIPFALDGHWTAAAWTMEGAAMVWVGLRQQQKGVWGFGLLLQLGAWLASLLHSGHVGAVDPNLFHGPFLAALMIGASMLFCARQFLLPLPAVSHVLLGGFALWWFARVIPPLAHWLDWHYGILTGRPWRESEWMVPLLIAMTSPVWLHYARQWRSLRWLMLANWLLLAAWGVGVSVVLYGDQPFPQRETWMALIALWLAGEIGLQQWLRHGFGMGAFWLRCLHGLRSVLPWILLWPVGVHWINLALADSPADAALYENLAWFTSASWSRYGPFCLMLLALEGLIVRIRSNAWPVAPLASWYQNRVLPLATGWALLVVALWNITQDGAMAPLPYLPLLNPLDLVSCFALVLAVRVWRMVRPQADPLPVGVLLLAWCWFNLMLLRTCSHWLGLPYDVTPLFESNVVQTILSLVWSVTALILMWQATRQQLPRRWLTGAALLALVVLKLFLVDQAGGSSVERIVAFLGVGLLMLLIGYVAPWPGQRNGQPVNPAAGAATGHASAADGNPPSIPPDSTSARM